MQTASPMFERGSSCPFPATITITVRAQVQAIYIRTCWEVSETTEILIDS